MALPASDAGQPGPGNGAEADGSIASGDAEAGAAPSVDGKQCGATFCEDQGGLFEPCCVADNICGKDVAPLAAISPDIPLKGCVEAHAKGIASDHCGQQYDIIDGDLAAGQPNGNFDLALGDNGDRISFPPCCTPTGECGVVVDEGMGQQLGLGCVPAAALAPAPGEGGVPGGDGGLALPTTDAGLPIIPNFNCNAASGGFACNPELPAFLPGACPLVTCLEGLPSFACGCGVGEYATVDLTDAIPGNDNCLPNLATTSCGCDDTVTYGPDNTEGGSDDCIANLPMLACGCGKFEVPTQDVTGAGYANNCVANVDPQVCGCSAAAVPSWICGCGTGVPYTGGIPCLAFKASDVCGTGPVDTSGSCIAGFDEYVQGCGATTVWDRSGGPSTFCVSNIANTLYGCDDVTTPVANVPGWICGCGEDAPYAGGLPCLSNVAASVCGDTPVDTSHGTPGNAADDCIEGFDEYVQGCGTGTVWDRSGGPSTFCVSNVANTLYGCDNVTAPVANVPAWICGCGEGVPYAGGLPCLSNVATDLCGATAIDTTNGTAENNADDCIAGFDEYVQGCGDGNVWDRSGGPSTFCVTRVSNTLYGCNNVSTPVANVPAWICGCGDGVPYAGGIPCLSNVAASVCGATAVDTTHGTPDNTADDCIAGFDEFVKGCGAATVWDRSGGPSTLCVSNVADTLYGCNNVSTPVANVPAWICGCGDGVPYASGIPCLSNVAADVCGATAVDTTGGCLVGFDEYVQGCGATTVWNRAGGPSTFCVSNAVTTLYGCSDVTTSPATLPAWFCGCGDGVVYDPQVNGFPCLSNVAATVCGATAVSVVTHPRESSKYDECLAGFDEYVQGCGVQGACITYRISQNNNPSRCLPTTSIYNRAIGVQNVCVSNAPSDRFGCNELTTGQVSGPPNFVCGCGDDVATGSCIFNVPKTVCGSTATCTTPGSITNNRCGASTPYCSDVIPKANAEPGSLVGDGVGDACAKCGPIGSSSSNGSNGCPNDGKTYRCDDLVTNGSPFAPPGTSSAGVADTCTDVTPPP